jgi:hypothetical protein
MQTSERKEAGKSDMPEEKATDPDTRWRIRFEAERLPEYRAKEAEEKAHRKAGRTDEADLALHECNAIAIRYMRESGVVWPD